MDSARRGGRCRPTLTRLHLNLAVSANPVDYYQVAVGSADGVVAVWDLRAERVIDECVFPQLHNGDVRRLMYHPKDPRYLVSGGEDGRLCLVDLGGGGGGGGGMGGGMGMGMGGGGVEELWDNGGMGCVDLAYDNTSNTLTAAFSSESVVVMQGHPKLEKGAGYS